MHSTTNTSISGVAALARGAIEAGVSLVTGYPGSPVTAVVNQILASTGSDAVHIEWNSNEKVAVEMAFGASVGGLRALLCVKSVGLNVALDPLMALNLTGCNAGMVVLVGDDPGGWGSQNEQDSRVLALASELPMLEPTTVNQAYVMMRKAFRLSENVGTPVFVRITRALALAETSALDTIGEPLPPPPAFSREFMRWVVLPINVVPYHRQAQQRLNDIRERFEDTLFNVIEGGGTYGVIAAGFAYQKLLDLLEGTLPSDLRVLRLGTFNPLPEAQLIAFLQMVDSVLVLEESAPWVERAVRDLAQKSRLTLPIYGRDTGHVCRVGEVFAPKIAKAINRWIPHLTLPVTGECTRPRPSRKPMCEGCPYIPTFDTLMDVMVQRGGHEHFIIVGDPGCMVKAQLEPYELLDVKNSLGSSIGMGAGLALSQHRLGSGKHVIAISGDSSFLHTGIQGLVDAARVGAPLTVIILDNGTTALSGGQPHPAGPVDARGASRIAVDIAALARDAGAGMVRVVDVDNGDDMGAALNAGLDFDGVAVIVARGLCRRWH